MVTNDVAFCSNAVREFGIDYLFKLYGEVGPSSMQRESARFVLGKTCKFNQDPINMQALVRSLFLLTLIFCFNSQSKSAETQPNIVFIFADDWGWGDLSCHGHPYVKTPNIDRLAKEGTDFHRFTVASGVCSPSRTAVMTGHFPARYNIDGHFAWVPSNAKRNMPDWLDPSAPLLQRILQQAGYRTAHYGKWHLANDMIPDSPTPAAYGYDDYGAFNCSGEQMPWHEDSKRTSAFMEESVKQGKPFFINVWMHEPHTPFHTVPKYEWRFRDLDREDQIYASVLSHADDRVGEILDTLDRLEITDNTLVVFSSDNGPARGSGPTELNLQYDTATGAGWGIAASKGITGGRRGYKAALFEGGIGVPFIARWPGRIPADKIDSVSLISAVDLLPTFCEVAKANLPPGYKPDGTSMLTVLQGHSMPTRSKPLYWKIGATWPARKTKPDHWVSWAVVHDRWKLVANRDLSHAQLFDITKDVGEKMDLKSEQSAVAEAIANSTEDLASFATRQTLGQRVFHPSRLASKLGSLPAGKPSNRFATVLNDERHSSVQRFLLTPLPALLIFAATARSETIPPGDFEVPDGYEISIWATTPQLYNPTNFDIDAQGRMWVTEAVNYRNFRNESLGLSKEQGDRVVVLQDTDGDGQADRSHTFVRDPDLVAPLGIGVIGNKVIVSCAPNILVYTDVDGDAHFDPQVDSKEVFLTGFRGLDHDHSLHSVKAGPDGYWYFNTGNGGAHTVTDKASWTLRAGSSYAGGSPHLTDNIPGRKSDDGRVWVGGVAMRIRPDGTGLQPLAHNFRNPYEETITSFGDMFHADNDDPPACRTTWIMENGNAGFSSADGSRSWKVDRRPGQTVRTAEWRQDDPGTLPAGDVYGYGAPTGIVFGENGCFEDQYPNGLLLSCESARGEIFRYVPQPQGAGFAMERSIFSKVKSGSAKHGWFRPSDIAVGVDGAIYLNDWYDAGVGGHRMTDATGSGTIYRIVPTGFTPSQTALDLSTTEGRIAALKSPTVNVRALGFEALKNASASDTEAIVELSRDANLFFAARATWLLPHCGGKGLDRISEILQHDDAQMRIVAFRALRAATTKSPSVAATFEHSRQKLASDPSPAMRREVALSLRDVPFDQCKGLIKTLAKRFDGWDRWYLEALGTACEGKEQEAYSLLVTTSDRSVQDWDRRIAAIAWRLHPPAAAEALASRAMSPKLPLAERRRMLDGLAFIPTLAAAKHMLTIATKGPEDLRDVAAWWGKNRDTNDWQTFELGKQFPEPPAAQSTKTATRPQLDFTPAGDPIYAGVVGADIDLDIRGVQRLYLMVDSTEAESIEAFWEAPIFLHGEGQVDVSTLNWTTAYSGVNTTGLGINKLKFRKPAKATMPAIVNTASGGKALAVRGRSGIAYDLSGGGFERFQAATRVYTTAEDSHGVRFLIYADRSLTGDQLSSIDQLGNVAASATLGRALFFSSRLQCGTCHTAAAYGGEIGPDLTQIARKHAPPVLLEAITNPSAAIATGFETMVVVTDQGSVYNGLLISAGNPVVLKDAKGKYHTIERESVDSMTAGRTSIMPDLKALLTAEELASIFAWLQELAEQPSR